MSVQYLSDAHFSNAGGRALRCNLSGTTFVMFKTENCQHCEQTIPLFQQLAQQDMRLTWAIVDVGRYRNLVAMSKSTSTPIRAVPIFILYVNGSPHANYKGKRSSPHIMAFLNKILASLNLNNQSFSQPTIPAQQNPYPQPTYQPKQGDSQNPQSAILTKEELNMPSNVTPHNAPYLAYKGMPTG